MRDEEQLQLEKRPEVSRVDDTAMSRGCCFFFFLLVCLFLFGVLILVVAVFVDAQIEKCNTS